MRFCQHASRSCFLLIALSMVVFEGCSDGKNLATVEGTVTKSGQPQEGLWVRFTPSAGGRPGNGRTDGSGHYEIEYTASRKGAHVGKNKVAIGTGGELDGRGNEISHPVQVFAKEIEVTSGANTIDFELDQ